jgi:hypothetical protein
MNFRIAALITLAWAVSSQAAVLTLVPALISRPSGVALDQSGNLYVADPSAPAIKKRDAVTGEVTTLVLLPDDSRPTGLAVDGSGNVFFADPYYNIVEKWSVSTGKVTTIVPSNLVRLNAFPFVLEGVVSMVLLSYGGHGGQRLHRGYLQQRRQEVERRDATDHRSAGTPGAEPSVCRGSRHRRECLHRGRATIMPSRSGAFRPVSSRPSSRQDSSFPTGSRWTPSATCSSRKTT